MIPPPELIDKDAIIATLLARISALETMVADLEAKLNHACEGPGKSSVPPSQGNKPSCSGGSKPKGKPHRGAHRMLHPETTHKLTVPATTCGCGTDVSGLTQSAQHTYDCVEILPIKPDLKQVTLPGRLCTCCGKWFKALAPAGLQPDSPFCSKFCALTMLSAFSLGDPAQSVAR